MAAAQASLSTNLCLTLLCFENRGPWEQNGGHVAVRHVLKNGFSILPVSRGKGKHVCLDSRSSPTPGTDSAVRNTVGLHPLMSLIKTETSVSQCLRDTSTAVHTLPETALPSEKLKNVYLSHRQGSWGKREMSTLATVTWSLRDRDTAMNHLGSWC